MKTDVVEIFQTIRASLQPYASRGYTVHKNSEKEYDLWSEKNIFAQGKKTTERFFAGIYIDENLVVVKVHDKTANDTDFTAIELKVLHDDKIKEIENLVAIAHDYFKEKEWV